MHTQWSEHRLDHEFDVGRTARPVIAAADEAEARAKAVELFGPSSEVLGVTFLHANHHHP